MGVATEHKEEISYLLSSIPIITYNRFLQTLTYLFLCLNDENIDLNSHFNLTKTDSIEELSEKHTENLYESRESQKYHNTWHFEQKLMGCIQSGDLVGLESLLKESTGNLSEGVLAKTMLRQQQNIFITITTSTTRSAIMGGMDTEQAYQLADLYIQECESMQNIQKISNLTYSMLVDFTRRVAEHKIPSGMSKELFECIQFITKHVNAPIQVMDVANHIGKSRSYLTSLFHRELDFDVSAFIMRSRLEEAKSLLTYSTKSLSEISTYLCFSSQSYFQNVFKRKYGLTPKQYHDQTTKMK